MRPKLFGCNGTNLDYISSPIRCIFVRIQSTENRIITGSKTQWISFVARGDFNQVNWTGEWTYTTFTLTCSRMLPQTTGHTTAGISAPFRVNLISFEEKITGSDSWENIETWLFFDASFWLNLTISNCDISICMRISRICFRRTVCCIWIIFKITILINPKWSKIFLDTIDIKFFDANLNEKVY